MNWKKIWLSISTPSWLFGVTGIIGIPGMIQDMQTWGKWLAMIDTYYIELYETISPYFFLFGVLAFIIVKVFYFEEKKPSANTKKDTYAIQPPANRDYPHTQGSVRERKIREFAQTLREENALQDAADVASKLYKPNEEFEVITYWDDTDNSIDGVLSASWLRTKKFPKTLQNKKTGETKEIPHPSGIHWSNR